MLPKRVGRWVCLQIVPPGERFRGADRSEPGCNGRSLILRRPSSLAPLSERYVIADANQADLLGARDRAERLFARAADLDPGSADAIAGLGVVAFQNGDRQGAQEYLARARSRDP